MYRVWPFSEVLVPLYLPITTKYFHIWLITYYLYYYYIIITEIFLSLVCLKLISQNFLCCFADVEKLSTFSQRFPLPSMYRIHVWKVLLGENNYFPTLAVLFNSIVSVCSIYYVIAYDVQRVLFWWWTMFFRYPASTQRFSLSGSPVQARAVYGYKRSSSGHAICAHRHASHRALPSHASAGKPTVALSVRAHTTCKDLIKCYTCVRYMHSQKKKKMSFFSG